MKWKNFSTIYDFTPKEITSGKTNENYYFQEPLDLFYYLLYYNDAVHIYFIRKNSGLD